MTKAEAVEETVSEERIKSPVALQCFADVT